MSHQCDARVVEVSGGDVWVELPAREAACGQCPGAEGCQGGMLGAGAALRRFRLENRIGAEVGDQVQLSIAEGMVWRATLASFGVPVLLAIAGAMVGQILAGEGASVLGMLAGLVCGLTLLRRQELTLRRSPQLFSLHLQSKAFRIQRSS